MLDQLQAFREAARRGVQWLLAQQNPDGSFIQPEMQADVYHKAVLALYLTGHAMEANRLLSWIKANDLGPNGRLRHFDEGLGLYKTSWICQGAHRAGRFDVSVPVMDFIETLQAPCGGFYQSPELRDYVEPVCSAWAGVAAIFLGRMQTALRAARYIGELVRQQPDPLRFYFHTTPEGTLLTGKAAPFVDATQPQQAYYCPGIAALFAVRLHLATGDAEHLRLARELFEFSLRCASDAYSYPTAGKSAVAAALIHMVAGDQRALEAALCMGDYLVREQSPGGWWRNPHADNQIIRLDHTAEFIIWLTEIVGALGATSTAR